jgi:hypothetical protein
MLFVDEFDGDDGFRLVLGYCLANTVGNQLSATCYRIRTRSEYARCICARSDRLGYESKGQVARKWSCLRLSKALEENVWCKHSLDHDLHLAGRP